MKLVSFVKVDQLPQSVTSKFKSTENEFPMWNVTVNRFLLKNKPREVSSIVNHCIKSFVITELNFPEVHNCLN